MKKKKMKKQQNKHNQKFHSFCFYRCDQIYRYTTMWSIDMKSPLLSVACLDIHVSPNRIQYLFNRKPISVLKKTMTTFTFHLWSHMHMKITKYRTNWKHFTRKKVPPLKYINREHALHNAHVSEMMQKIQMCGCIYRRSDDEKNGFSINSVNNWDSSVIFCRYFLCYCWCCC